MKQKILIVEDDQPIRELYKIKLQTDGFEVVCAEDGTEGLKLAKEFNPELILLDLLMPEMNGDEMLRQLRSKPWGKHIKVLVLTNVSRDEAPMGLRQLSVEDYLIKAQYTPKQVVDVVEKVLKP